MTLTQHPSFDAEGACLVAHVAPACPFVAHGAVPTGAGLRTIDCRFCVGGDDPASLGRPAFPYVPDGDTERYNANRKAPSQPHDDGPRLTPEERFARVAAWLVALERKVEVMDITHQNKRVAQDWLRAYAGTLSFLVDVRDRGKALSDAQAKGVLNCLRAELLRGPEAPAVAAVPAEVADYLP